LCEEKYQSYPGIIRGGVIATILDCVMTNCLLMKGIPAVTADMHVEYLKPLRVGSLVGNGEDAVGAFPFASLYARC